MKIKIKLFLFICVFASLRLITLFADQNEIFEEKPEGMFYIKKKYYTAKNISEGEQFFEMNCAVCHGKEADGSGIRSEAMTDSKPRMLTNLDWMHTRDDLRLLRSIKYGVPGTAMVPWGDQTSSLQRMQLVIFIRSLSVERMERERLMTALYEAFESAQITVEQMRTKSYKRSLDLEEQIEQTKKMRMELENQAKDSTKIASIIQQEIDLKKKMAVENNSDKLFVDLKSLLKKQSDGFLNLGITLLSNKQIDPQGFDLLVQILDLYKNSHGQNSKGELIYLPVDVATRKEAEKRLISYLNKDVEAMNKTDNQASVAGLIRLRNQAIATLEEADRLQQQQKELFQKIQPEKQPEANG